MDLERESPQQQCHAFATHDIIFAMHGSSLGNLICVTPASVVIEVFPSGFHLDFFSMYAAALDVTLLQITDGKNATPMSRGMPPEPWGLSQDAARDCTSFQPDSNHVTKALGYASSLIRRPDHHRDGPSRSSSSSRLERFLESECPHEEQAPPGRDGPLCFHSKANAS